MNTKSNLSTDTNEFGLDDVVEPLASFICAADRPAVALRTVLSALHRQVEQTNRAAKVRIAALTEHQIAVPA